MQKTAFLKRPFVCRMYVPAAEDILEAQMGVPTTIPSYAAASFSVSMITVVLSNAASIPNLKNLRIPILFFVSKISSMSLLTRPERGSATFFVVPVLE